RREKLITKRCALSMSRLIRIGIPSCLGIIGILALSSKAQQPRQASSSSQRALKIDYNFEVRPILSDNCFRCHGPDAKSRQAGLRLDQQESAYEQAIVPRRPQESEMIRRTSSKDPAYRMPPPAASAKPLTDAE